MGINLDLSQANQTLNYKKEIKFIFFFT